MKNKMVVRDFLTKDLTADENVGGKAQPVANFIRFKMEPFFEYILYVIGIVIILVGAIMVIYTGIKEMRVKGATKKTQDEILTLMRIRLSEYVSLGLTFILGAEVIKTFRVPNMYQLIKVALLVLLRQLITYFLDKDVAHLRREFPTLIRPSKIE